ncbi:MAG: TlpA family protein disulfide reductase [Bacteriovoracaceae bacterium]|nr:TlpA family protein disulfide reductase [Bacteriovoracaceae bacterium]
MMKVIIIGCFVSLVGVYSYLTSRNLSDMDSAESVPVLKELPAIKLVTMAGQEKALYQYLDNEPNHHLVVHFWATWCGPCEVEFPALVKLAKSLEGQGVKFLFVAVNDDPKKIEDFIQRFQNHYPQLEILLDTQEAYKEHFGTSRLPETYIFNKMKKTVRKFAGAMAWEEEYFTQFFKSLKE